MPELIPIENLLLHAKPMLLLDSMIHCGPDFIVCELVVRSDNLFDSNNRVPSLLGLEYMAQSVAAFSGLEAVQRKEKPQLGFLLGTRKFVTNVAEFRCGEKLTVTASQTVKTKDGMAAFECILEGEKVQQSATLTVYQPTDPELYLSQVNA